MNVSQLARACSDYDMTVHGYLKLLSFVIDHKSFVLPLCFHNLKDGRSNTGLVASESHAR